MSRRLIYLVSVLWVTMGAYATAELAQAPVAVAPTAESVKIQKTPHPLFDKHIDVTVPQYSIRTSPTAAGVPLKQTSTAVIRSSAVAMGAGQVSAHTSVRSATIQTMGTGVAVAVMPRIQTRTSLSNHTFVSADAYLENMQRVVRRNTGSTVPSPPGGEPPPEYQFPLTTTWGDLCLFVGLCLAYVAYRQRKRCRV